jgi:glycine dehydrogenase subunit 1
MSTFRHSFLPNSEEQQKAMLAKLNLTSVEELFKDIPSKFKFKGKMNIPEGLSETEVSRYIEARLEKNVNPGSFASFLGGGVWSHIVPEVVHSVTSRTEFYTAYTPYQAEISQGMLQALFEYQSLIAELLELPVVNASMYDWASSLGEAALMTHRLTRRSTFLIPEFLAPNRRAVLSTYTAPANMETKTIPCDPIRGKTDLEKLKEMMSSKITGVYIENPAYLGYLEPDVEAIAEIAHDAGALFVVGVDPISLGVLRPPGDYEADIVIGEGQPLGNGLNLGGALLGLFACKDDRKILRQIPGRLIGLTTTLEGDKRGFVMTLQAREQHIRRENATSNICSNQALCAVAAAVYLCALGPTGLRELGERILQLRHYMEQKLSSIKGVLAPKFQAPHFKEFVYSLEKPKGKHLSVQRVLKKLNQKMVLGGIPLHNEFPKLGESALVCVTELQTKENIDRFTAVLQQTLEVG